MHHLRTYIASSALHDVVLFSGPACIAGWHTSTSVAPTIWNSLDPSFDHLRQLARSCKSHSARYSNVMVCNSCRFQHLHLHLLPQLTLTLIPFMYVSSLCLCGLPLLFKLSDSYSYKIILPMILAAPGQGFLSTHLCAFRGARSGGTCGWIHYGSGEYKPQSFFYNSTMAAFRTLVGCATRLCLPRVKPS